MEADSFSLRASTRLHASVISGSCQMAFQRAFKALYISFENSFENQLLQSAEYQHFQFIIQFLGTRKNSMLLVTTCNY